MIKIPPKIVVINPPTLPEAMAKTLLAARNCYASFDKASEDADIKLVQHLIDKGHTSVLEQWGFNYVLITNRGVHNEDVRQRTGISHAVQSSRYCNFSGETFGKNIRVIDTLFFKNTQYGYTTWEHAMEVAEEAYLSLLRDGASAQEAREVLPLSLAVSDVQYANCTGLRYRFNQRCAKTAHPEFRRLMLPFLLWCAKQYPPFFVDIKRKFEIEYDRFDSCYGSHKMAEVIVYDGDIRAFDVLNYMK